MVIVRRVVVDGIRGDFAPVFETWAKWTQNAGALAAVSGQREDPIDLLVTVNDNPKNRTISNADRAVMGGSTYEIDSVGRPERKTGTIGVTLRQKANA